MAFVYRAQEIERRRSQEVFAGDLAGKTLAIDGFNLLITLESALSGGYIFKCRDGAYRDMAGISGSYKWVRQTARAIELVAERLKKISFAYVHWYLDAPISNSGRLATLIRETGEEQRINWTVELVADPDRSIIDTPGGVAVSSDSWVMDDSARWYNLLADVLPELNSVQLVEV